MSNINLSFDAALIVVSVIGQSTMILAAALLAERLARRNATARHAVLFCGLVGVLLLPVAVIVERRLGIELVTVPIGVAEQPSTDEQSRPMANGNASSLYAAMPVDLNGETNVTLNDEGSADPGLIVNADSVTTRTAYNSETPIWMWLAFLVWAAGSFLSVLRTMSAWLALRRLRRQAVVPTCPVLQSTLDLVRKSCTRSIPDVFISTGLRAPLSAGLWRPFVLLPANLTLTESELRQVLLHEFAHVWRRDWAVVCLQRLAIALFWPNPLLHWLNCRLTATREDICDDYVIAEVDAPSYSRTLLKVSIACGMPARLATCLFSSTRKLEHRIRDLLDERRKPMIHLRSSLSVGIAVTFAAVVVGLAAVRTQAQAQAQEESRFVKVQSDPTWPTLVLHKMTESQPLFVVDKTPQSQPPFVVHKMTDSRPLFVVHKMTESQPLIALQKLSNSELASEVSGSQVPATPSGQQSSNTERASEVSGSQVPATPSGQQPNNGKGVGIDGRAKWEYKVVSLFAIAGESKNQPVPLTWSKDGEMLKASRDAESQTTKRLDQLGADGWELVGIANNQYIFKRSVAK